MTNQNIQTEVKETSLQKSMSQDWVVERFAQVLGSDLEAQAFIQTVLITVANDEDLQKCTIRSVISAALESASLGLSVSRSGAGKAYLVPYKNICTFQEKYTGLIEMADRTGEYRFINVFRVWPGQEVIQDTRSGTLEIVGEIENKDQHLGWFGAFELRSGRYRAEYMTIEEIHDHKERYSKGWESKFSPWQTSPEAMEKKTVLRKLLKEGPLKPYDSQRLARIKEEFEHLPEEQAGDEFTDLDESEVIEGELKEQPPKKDQTEPESPEQERPDNESLIQAVIDSCSIVDRKEAIGLLSIMKMTKPNVNKVKLAAGWYQAGLDMERGHDASVKMMNGQIAQSELAAGE